MNTLEEMERKVSYIERVQNQRWWIATPVSLGRFNLRPDLTQLALIVVIGTQKMAAYVFAHDLWATGPDYNDDFVISCFTDCDKWGIAFRNGLLANFVRGGEVQFAVMRTILITFKSHARSSFSISELTNWNLASFA